MTVLLPFSPLPGADQPNSLAEAQQGNNDALATAVTPQRPTAYGTATLSFAASNDASVTVAHGLGAAPSNVQVTPRSAGTSSIRAPACNARDATNITIAARTGDGANTTMTVVVDWVAVV